jgi:hypothetical protein
LKLDENEPCSDAKIRCKSTFLNVGEFAPIKTAAFEHRDCYPERLKMGAWLLGGSMVSE